MSFTPVTTFKNLMLNAGTAAITSLSLHSGSPGTTGANEISGSGYAKQTPSWSAAANSTAALSTGVSFSVPASTIAYVGAWAGATFRGYWTVTPETFGAPGTYSINSGSLSLTNA